MPIVVSANRASCDRCGGWVDAGLSPVTWAARLAEFSALHSHPAWSPQVYNLRLLDNDRDAFAAAVDSSRKVCHGYAPLGSNVVAFVSAQGTASIRDTTLVQRIIASSPGELAGQLA